MAMLEKRGKWFRIIFKYGGQRFTHSLKTQDGKVAEALKGGIERTLMLLGQHVLHMPEGADALTFILHGGQVVQPLASMASRMPEASATPTTERLTLKQLYSKYTETLAVGSVEENTLATIKMHLRHFIRTLGSAFAMHQMKLTHLQDHVLIRAKEKGIRGRRLSSTTMQKEMASLRAAWNWAVQTGLLSGAFQNRGLKYPKTTDKQPFQTWKEIERQILQGGLDEDRQQEMWDCLFLTHCEIAELLAFVKSNAQQPFVYPMFCFAAYTGARRSEMLRATIADVDMEAATVRIHEKKRSHGKRTSRRVPLSPFLQQVLRQWLAVHPGGQALFSQSIHVFRSKKRRTEATAITRDEASDHFKRTLASGKWKVLRGWHCLRHSFISHCAAQGIDQRMLDQWVGHTTEEMRRRYMHLVPSNEQQAITRVFDGTVRAAQLS